MYPTGYGRFSVTDNVCNTSFAQVDVAGAPVAVSATTKAQSFALANGTANGTPASVVYNDSVGGPRVWNSPCRCRPACRFRPRQRALPARPRDRRRR